jgi:hypothetical protein
MEEKQMSGESESVFSKTKRTGLFAFPPGEVELVYILFTLFRC